MATLKQLKSIAAKARKAYNKADAKVTAFKRNIERPALSEKHLGKCFKNVDIQSDGKEKYVYHLMVVELAGWDNNPICFKVMECFDNYSSKEEYSASIELRYHTYFHLLGTPIARTEFDMAYADALKRIALPK